MKLSKGGTLPINQPTTPGLHEPALRLEGKGERMSEEKRFVPMGEAQILMVKESLLNGELSDETLKDLNLDPQWFRSYEPINSSK